jgi:murein L,D-transpeptidase YafK
VILLSFLSCSQPSIESLVPTISPPFSHIKGQTIFVDKSDRTLALVENGTIRKINNKPAIWHIGLGDAPIGHKQKEGDEKTPEGLYSFSDHAPSSSYHGSLLIHYPNQRDAQDARSNKKITKEQYDQIIQNTNKGFAPPMNTGLGGFILIHGAQKKTGLPPFSGSFDWTDGCIAMDNDNLDVLRSNLNDIKGTIEIVP